MTKENLGYIVYWPITNPEADPADDDHQSTGKEVAPDVERHFPLQDQDKSRTRVALILEKKKN